jgi:hypothetical protein
MMGQGRRRTTDRAASLAEPGGNTVPDVLVTVHGITQVAGYAAIFFQNVRALGFGMPTLELTWPGASWGAASVLLMQNSRFRATQEAALNAQLTAANVVLTSRSKVIAHSEGSELTRGWLCGKPPVGWTTCGTNATLLGQSHGKDFDSESVKWAAKHRKQERLVIWAAEKASSVQPRPLPVGPWWNIYRLDDPWGEALDPYVERPLTDIVLASKPAFIDPRPHYYWDDPDFALAEAETWSP